MIGRTRETYLLGYYRIFPGDTGTGVVRDGNPDIEFLREVDADGGMNDLGTIRLSEAHVLDVEVVDDDGDPVAGVDVRVAHGGYGTGGVTNNDGLLQFDLQETGIELPDTDESDRPVEVTIGDLSKTGNV